MRSVIFALAFLVCVHAASGGSADSGTGGSSAVDGIWSQWSNFEDCTKPCGGGQQVRSRLCSRPVPSHGGLQCSKSGSSGDRDLTDVESRSCNTQPCADCTFYLTGNEGEIVSPGYPSNYKVNKDCFWHISVNKGEKIQLIFKDMDIESEKQCIHDFIHIRDGTSNDAPELGKYCGNILPEILTSSKNGINIHFHSDAQHTRKGFKIQWRDAGLKIPQSVGNTKKPSQGKQVPENLNLVEMEIGYQGLGNGDFLKLWLDDVKYYLKQQKAGTVKYLLKAVAERKVYMVFNTSAAKLDAMMLNAPLMKKLGNKAKVQVTGLLPYETYANSVNEIIGKSARYNVNPEVKPESKKGLYFWVVFNQGYTGTLNEFLQTMSREAKFAESARKAGLIVDIWKSTGIPSVQVLVKVQSAEVLDNIVFGLPIMKENGANMDVHIKPLISFGTFAESLKTVIGQL